MNHKGMKAEFTEVWFEDGVEITGSQKQVELPFKRVSARAIIIRRSDLKLLGTLHRRDGMVALPGGSVENGEKCDQSLTRELVEENMILVDPDPDWRENIAVDYFPGYQELSVWYLIPVKDVDLAESEENIETKWIEQKDDPWYPGMRERIILTLKRYKPELTCTSVEVV